MEKSNTSKQRIRRLVPDGRQGPLPSRLYFGKRGVIPTYHRNRTHRPDRSAADEAIKAPVGISYNLTKGGRKR